jgi:hypothetical protein
MIDINCEGMEANITQTYSHTDTTPNVGTCCVLIFNV